MKIFWKKNNIEKNKKTTIENKPMVSFTVLNHSEQDALLKKGAAAFSKKFTKTMVQLANE